uniref:Uncharacterized protein n=1 Tax=Trichogramma kaykai TaxID=54128 RepID=A0ABD2WPG0_9HYME
MFQTQKVIEIAPTTLAHTFLVSSSKKLGAIQCSGARGANINNKARLTPSAHTCFSLSTGDRSRAPMTRALLYRLVYVWLCNTREAFQSRESYVCMCVCVYVYAKRSLIGYRRRERHTAVGQRDTTHCTYFMERRREKNKEKRSRMAKCARDDDRVHTI